MAGAVPTGIGAIIGIAIIGIAITGTAAIITGAGSTEQPS
jgi:hypothetical protein